MKFKNIFLMSALLFGFQEVKPVCALQDGATIALAIVTAAFGLVEFVSKDSSRSMVGAFWFAASGMLFLQNYQLKNPNKCEKCEKREFLESHAKKSK